MDRLPVFVEGFVADIGTLFEIEGQLDVGLDVGFGIVMELRVAEGVIDGFVGGLFWCA